MILYHITNRRYEIGAQICVDNFDGDTTYYYRERPQCNWIDDFLSAERPQNVPDRRKAIFAFSSPCHCVHFFEQKILSGQLPFLYKVEMDVESGYPMRLCRCLENVGNNEDANIIKEAIRHEYWWPTLDWKIKEYIGTQMTILEILPLQNMDMVKRKMDTAKGKMDYDIDVDLADRFINNI